ncbi:MAG: DinB family protein [Acidobacteria bacterium]|nr:DinB family protein [Acidobacteriota bacterium]
MNPYASFLGDQDPVEVLSRTPQRLEAIVASLGESRLNQQPQPDHWSGREILIHLADTELAFAFRYRQALGEDNHVIQPFDQDGWARSYAVYSAQQALRTYTVLRDWNLALLRSLTGEQMSRSLSHPERGHMAFRTLVDTAAGHDINHLRQLEAMANRPPA